MRESILLLFIVCQNLLHLAQSQALYNHNSASYRNQTWMSNFDDGVPLRRLTIMGTHSSMSQGTWGDAFQTQASSLTVQLEAGIRALDIRCRHKDNAFPIHQRLIYLNTDLGGVLNTVRNFLTAYPSEVVIMHIVEEYNPSGNTRSFQETFISYRDAYADLIWTPTTQNPTLGMTRGKVVILQHFNGAIHGILYDTFTTIEHKQYSTNWDQHDRWISIKNFMADSNTAGQSRIAFWTGSVGSFPYFCASGKSSPGNNAPRLATGLTTPGFKDRYPEFPRVACFIGICTIAFEGINTLGYNYYTGDGLTYLGITFVDFFGDTLISSAIALNSQLFEPCTATQNEQGCMACSNSGTCLSCNQQIHYILNQATGDCDAQVGYYLNATSYPELCWDAMAGCLECSAEDICTVCDTFLNYQLINSTCEAADGYYLDSNSTPIKCQIYGCYLCSSETDCTECSEINNFIMDPMSFDCVCDSSEFFMAHPFVDTCICQAGYFLSVNGSVSSCELMPLCPDVNSGCLVCGAGNNCQTCDEANGFVNVPGQPYCACEDGSFFDGTQCIPCNLTLDGCDICLSEILCIECTDNFTLLEGQCVCELSFYQFDSSTCLACEVGCLTCTGPTSCTFCDQQSSFQLVAGVCQCQKGMFLQNETCHLCGSMAGCIDCNMDGCTQCDPMFGFQLNGTECACAYGQYITSMSICAQCRIQGCLDCDTETNCVECDESFYFLTVGGTCEEICGDGLLFNLECDDGNTVSGDGCSSTCKVENDFTCSGGSSTNSSQCSYSGEVKLKKMSFLKKENANEATLKLKIQPAIPLFSTINYGEAIIPNFPINSKKVTYDEEKGQITYTFTYGESLNTRDDMAIKFQPPQDDLSFYYTPSVSAAVPTTTDNNLALKVYDDEVYDTVPTIKALSLILLFLAIAVFLFGFFGSSKLMAVEMIAVLQLSYIGLMMIDKLQALVYPLVNLWPINGYNNIIADGDQVEIPPRVSTIGYKGFFLANFSINLVLALLPFIIGGIMFIMARRNQDAVEKKKKKKRASKVMKQWGLSVLLFIQYHLTVSIVIAFLYGVTQIFGAVLGIILCLGLITMAILLYKRPANFGQYKSFFETDKKLRSNFYLILISLRLLLGIGIPALNESPSCCYFAVVICLIQLISIAILLPYKQNLRPITNSSIILLIMIVYTVYRNRIVDETQWMTTYLPLFLITILFFTVFINLGFMIKHSVCYKRKQKMAKKAKEEEWEELKNVVKSEIKKSLKLDSFQPGFRMNISKMYKDVPDSPSHALFKEIKGQLGSDRKTYLNQYENGYDEI